MHTDLHIRPQTPHSLSATHNLLEAHTPLQSSSWPARTRRCTHNLSHAPHAHLKQLCAVCTHPIPTSRPLMHTHTSSAGTRTLAASLCSRRTPHPRTLLARCTPPPRPCGRIPRTPATRGALTPLAAAARAPPHLFRPRRAIGPRPPWGWSPG